MNAYAASFRSGQSAFEENEDEDSAIRRFLQARRWQLVKPTKKVGAEKIPVAARRRPV